MKNTSFTAVDVETATNSRFICQIGIVSVVAGEIKEKISILVQPPNNYYDTATTFIHHITPDQTANAPHFNEVWPTIHNYFEGKIVVAHNSSFDEDALRKNLDYYNIFPLGLSPFICTCKLYNGISLENLCRAFNMDCGQHHDALFDATCCAQFYLNYLNGVCPDPEIMEVSCPTRKSSAKARTRTLRGNILEKDLSVADENSPFYDRNIVITGVFRQERKEIAIFFRNRLGADINTSITKRTHFVLIGEDPGPYKIEKIDKLIHDGYNIRKLYQSDIDAILSGEWEGYHVAKEVKKQLDFTIDHYRRHCITFEGMNNIIATKELFFGKNFSGNIDLLRQITGNLGAFGDTDIYPETNICVLSDNTIELLSHGTKDETIAYIEDYYNNRNSITFDFSFLSESAILDYCRRRCEWCGDKITMSLYMKYIHSLHKNA